MSVPFPNVVPLSPESFAKLRKNSASPVIPLMKVNRALLESCGRGAMDVMKAVWPSAE